jgi:hypothetical protein
VTAGLADGLEGAVTMRIPGAAVGRASIADAEHTSAGFRSGPGSIFEIRTGPQVGTLAPEDA